MYKIKAAFFCNKNFSNSLEELKSFLGFELNKINLQEQSNLINRENQVMIVDNSFSEFTLLDKINIPKILIIDKHAKDNFKNKFDTIVQLPLNILEFNTLVINLSQKYKFDENSLIKINNYTLDKNTKFLKKK